MTIARFELNFELAFAYFKEKLEDINALSLSLLSVVDFKSGNFFSLLPVNIDNCHIHHFKCGGIKSCVRDFTESMVLDKLLIENNLFCIFDEVTFKDFEMQDNPLFIDSGLVYQDEIYYFLNKNTATLKKVVDCFCASEAIWHSLCVLTRTKFVPPPDRKLSKENLQDFCENAELILVGAYDAEGYVFWERTAQVADPQLHRLPR